MEFWTIFPIILLFILFFLKIPVAFSMLMASAVYYIFSPDSMNVTMMIQKMVAANSSFTYLAIPFFTCAGVIFNYSGISTRLMNLAECIVGHMAGGLGQVNIVLSAMMGGLSGSANADAALETKLLVPEMERLGYSRAFSCVVTAASSCITPIIPPGIILILYASSSNVSIGKIFSAGYLPGLIIMLGLMILTRHVSHKRGYKPSRETRATMKEFGKTLIDSIWALFVPFGLVMGLRFGLFTPTEAGAMCIAYALAVGIFIYRELKVKDLIPIIKESVTATAGVMFILSGAQAFSSYLTWERLPNIISEFMLANINSPIVFLMVVNALLLIVGCFFDGGAAMILLAPLLVPAAESLGIDLIHFGIVLCINLTIAGITPPFGSQMFVTTSIAGLKIEDYAKESIPYIGCMILILFLITYIPQITLIVPRLLGM